MTTCIPPGALGILVTAVLPVQTPLVQALAVSGGILVATGTNADMLALQSSATIVKDFRGAFILPVSSTHNLTDLCQNSLVLLTFIVASAVHMYRPSAQLQKMLQNVVVDNAGSH